MDDPFLNYVALGLLFFVVIVLFYGIIAIHDIPAQIAKARHHPHEDAIHAAGWVSLFMLHALWPFLWIWAMSYKSERGWGFSHRPGETEPLADAAAEVAALKRRLAEVEAKVATKDRSVRFEEEVLTRLPEDLESPGKKESMPVTRATRTGSPGAKR